MEPRFSRSCSSRGTVMFVLTLLLPILETVTSAPLTETSVANPDISHSTRISNFEASKSTSGRQSYPIDAIASLLFREISRRRRSADLEAASVRDSSEEGATTAPEVSESPKSGKRGRKHKAFVVDFPLLQQLQQYSNVGGFYNDEGRTPNKRKYQESDIYYIRLPPTPYMYVPGLGYISQPPTYSTAGLRPRPGANRPSRPNVYQQSDNPFINLPIDFVSNGKPTSVYQWPKGPNKKKYDSQVTKLDKGPYHFNGKPTSLYLLGPDGKSSFHQSIRYPEYRNDVYY